MVRIQDSTPPERLRRIIGRFSSNNHGCILFQRMFIDKDRENALSLAKSALQPRDRQADENLRAVRERYRHGLVSHTEVLDAETLGSRAT